MRTVYPALTISGRRLRNGCALNKAARNPASIAELFAQDPLFEAMAGIKQHSHRNAFVRQHFDAPNIARLVVIGDGCHRPLLTLQYFDDDVGSVGQQRPAPAAWTK